MPPKSPNISTDLAIEEFTKSLAAALKRIREQQQAEASTANTQPPVASQPQPIPKEHSS